MQFQIGERVGDYEIVQVLGAGGMGRVYKVRNLISDRIEALKVLLPDLQSEPALVDRFLREIKVQATLSHPNIASLYTALRHNNQLLMLMEFVEGQSVEKELEKLGRVPVDTACSYVEQVLRALAYAHGRGVVHRDIKPANIVVTPEGHVKLMDFGIAKLRSDKRLTQTGTTLGSIYYMSPEQINGGELDPRSDIYSLGITMYEMVTGKRPFEGPSDYSVMAGHLQMAPAAPIEIVPNVPSLLNEVILMALAKDPQQRFQSAEAFRTAILNVRGAMQPVAGQGMGQSSMAAPATRTTLMPPGAQPAPPQQPVSAPPVGPPVTVVGEPSRRGLWMALGSLVAIGVLAAGLVLGPKFFSSRADSPPQTAADPVPQQPASSASVPSSPAQEVPPGSQAEATPASPGQSGTPVRPAQHTPAPVTPVQRAQNQPTVSAPPAQPASQEPAPPTQQATAPQQAAPKTPAPSQPAVDTAALDAQHDRMVKMGSRAVAVRDKLNRLQAEQNAMGLGMRSDFKAALTRMEQYLDAAEDALKAQDPAKAKQSLDRADRDLDFLEDKLGIH
ncbi:MAG: protein kinase [Bryobacterales bacterium]|nr:protein kinase [Bryobacterales bacterium]